MRRFPLTKKQCRTSPFAGLMRLNRELSNLESGDATEMKNGRRVGALRATLD
jgi:hypothetical protein